jgi:hypothetical protein
MNILVFAFLVMFAGPAMMVVGLIVMFASLVRRRIGTPLAARLLFMGPGVSLIGAALVVVPAEFDPLAHAALVLLLLSSGVGVCVAALRAQIRFAPVKRT